MSLRVRPNSAHACKPVHVVFFLYHRQFRPTNTGIRGSGSNLNLVAELEQTKKECSNGAKMTQAEHQQGQEELRVDTRLDQANRREFAKKKFEWYRWLRLAIFTKWLGLGNTKASGYEIESESDGRSMVPDLTE